MKVIFLDFNGVLDTYENMDTIDEINLHILINAIKKTEAKVVITSSNKNVFYRVGKHNKIIINLLNTLKQNNIEILGITKYLNTREEEILDYLKTHPQITHYCILDDDYIFESMKEHQIKLTNQNDGGNGLQETSIEDIVRKLNI